jgi:disulfide bond formation protein DsbB
MAVVNRSDDRGWLLVFAAWVIASAATLGALFFSEIMQLPPCLLCWYQRIFMFPLVLLLPLGLFPFDPKVVRYALPLACTGGVIAVYHQLLVMGVVPESAGPCTRGIPCAEVQIEWLGFITIPLLAVAAFTSIIVLLLIARSRTSQ